MNTAIEENVLPEIARACEVTGVFAYRIGERTVSLEGLDPQTQFVTMLRDDLYARLYRRPRVSSQSCANLDSRQFVEMLSRANTGSGTWEPDWKTAFEQTHDGRTIVEKEGIRYALEGDRLRIDADTVRIRSSKELRHLLPGFYLANGDADEPARGDAGVGPLVRFYWNLQADAAAEYVERMTHALNRAALPFRTKVLSDPRAYAVADAGVLYMRKAFVPQAISHIRELYACIGRRLESETPMFAKRLAPGLAVAEDPHDGQSFGQSRCNLVAQALVRAHERGVTGEAERLAEIEASFVQAGIDPRRPHLQPGSIDTYEVFEHD